MTSSVSNLKKRIVITGLGVVAPSGIGKDAFWEAVVQGWSPISWVTSFDASDLYCQIAGEVKDFDPSDYMGRAAARKAGRFSHFAVAAARLALEDAAVDLSRIEPFRMGACFGTSLAGNGNIADEMYEEFMTKGPKRIDLSAGVELSPHAATSHVFIEFGMRGPNATTSTGCVSSLDAVVQARTLLQTGEADLIVAGGTEACVSRVGMTLLCKIGVLSHRNEEPEKASRPYDATRDGLVLSEGAGAVVLETAEHALNRGAHIYAEVRGYGCATEAQHLIAADPSGAELAQAFRAALLDARLAPQDLDYVCAHGISNRDYDTADTRAIKMALGERAHNIPVSSIKSSTGQPFAAGGTWQTAAACMSIRDNVVPPTINYHIPDPNCDLDYVPNQARRARVDTVMMNSHSFGGTHGALIISAFDRTWGAH